MRWPVKKVYITQPFGVNPDIYKRFGYKGHNGCDLRMFDEQGNRSSSCLVFAPHDGVIKERRNDLDGYGNYLKIENNVEGSVLAHLKEFKVNINKQVTEGELVAVGDNTGWSTAAHLHWGYYMLPRNRENGYGGFIDQKPFMGENSVDMAVPGWLKQMFLELGIDLEKPEGEIRGKVQEVIDAYRNKDKITELRKQLKSTNEMLADKALELSSLQDEIEKQEAKALDAEAGLLEARGERDKEAWAKEQAQAKVKTLEDEAESNKEHIEVLESEKEALRIDLVSCQAGILQGLGKWRGLVYAIKNIFRIKSGGGD